MDFALHVCSFLMVFTEKLLCSYCTHLQLLGCFGIVASEMQHLAIQDVSFYQETLLNNLRKGKKVKGKRKKVLGPSSHLIAEASLPILKLNKHSTLCSAHFSKRWCQFSWKDLETDKMDSQWGILYHLDLTCSLVLYLRKILLYYVISVCCKIQPP